MTARETIDRGEGRRVFGRDPAAYDRARAGHPERVYEVLRARCGLGPDTRVLEIGPGPGTVTRRLLELGVRSLVAVEPDPALAAYLRSSVGDGPEILVTTLEEAALPADTFDLAVAASSFHWVEPEAGLATIGLYDRLLRAACAPCRASCAWASPRARRTRPSRPARWRRGPSFAPSRPAG